MKQAGASLPHFLLRSMRMWRSEHAQIFLERLTVRSLVGLNLAGARPPRLTAKLSKPRCPPGGALLLEPTARQLVGGTKRPQVRFRYTCRT